MILKNIAFTSLAMLLLTSGAAHATKTLTSPYVSEGRAVVELRTGHDFMENDDNDTWRWRTLASYGVTSFWDTRVSATWSHRDETTTDAWAWENKFQLAPTGAWPIDTAVRIDYSDATNGNPDKISAHLIGAKKFGDLSNTANFTFGREVGDGSSNDMTFDFAYGISHPVTDNYSLGLEYYAGFKDFDNDFDEQEHALGPVVYATHGPLRYQGGALVGISEAAPDVALKANISYSFDLLK